MVVDLDPVDLPDGGHVDGEAAVDQFLVAVLVVQVGVALEGRLERVGQFRGRLALDDGEVSTFQIDPIALGLAPAIGEELVGGEPEENAEYVRRVLGGEHGPHRDIVVLNAAAGLVVAGVVESIEDGLVVAANSIDSGAAASTLKDFVEVSQSVATR